MLSVTFETQGLLDLFQRRVGLHAPRASKKDPPVLRHRGPITHQVIERRNSAPTRMRALEIASMRRSSRSAGWTVLRRSCPTRTSSQYNTCMSAERRCCPRRSRVRNPHSSTSCSSRPASRRACVRPLRAAQGSV